MKQIFINLPVKDLEKSLNLYTELGFVNKVLFSDENQKCMVWNESIYVMLLSQKQFISYSKKNISNENNINAYFTLPVESVVEMNKIVENGLKTGAKEPISMIDEGFMQIRRIEDFDGHIWDIMYLDSEKFKKN